MHRLHTVSYIFYLYDCLVTRGQISTSIIVLLHSLQILNIDKENAKCWSIYFSSSIDALDETHGEE